MNIGDLIIWKRKIFSYIDEQELGFSQDVGLLIDILEVDMAAKCPSSLRNEHRRFNNLEKKNLFLH
jgi:hypothetical protein